MRAYSLGVLHYHAGVRRSAHPFNAQLDTLSHDLWEAGWLDEEENSTCSSV